MRTWERARRDRCCGRCGATIVMNDPFVTLSRAGRDWELVRCRECAGEPVPDLPPLPIRATTPMTPIAALTSTRQIVRDGKLAAIREPGEDDA